MPKTCITLILPGVAAVLNHSVNNAILPSYLKKIIKYARFQAYETGLQRLLLNQFSQDDITSSDLPLASFWGDNLLFADPCYLHPDHERLLLFSEGLAISTDERRLLMAEIQPVLADFNAHIVESDDSEHCLLTIEQQAKPNFTALEDVSKKGLKDSLPQGAERKKWLQLWNEIQMQLHICEVNQRRVQKGKYPINSLWFWGAGEFTLQQKRWDGLCGSHTLLTRLAEQSQLKLSNSFDITSKGKQLWLMDAIDTELDWETQLNIVDEQVFQQLWQAVRLAKIKQIKLHIPEYGVFTLLPSMTWCFWKK